MRTINGSNSTFEIRPDMILFEPFMFNSEIRISWLDIVSC
jgi:hypothetical protein